jgi:hypothetical protein
MIHGARSNISGTLCFLQARVTVNCFLSCKFFWVHWVQWLCSQLMLMLTAVSVEVGEDQGVADTVNVSSPNLQAAMCIAPRSWLAKSSVRHVVCQKLLQNNMKGKLNREVSSPYMAIYIWSHNKACASKQWVDVYIFFVWLCRNSCQWLMCKLTNYNDWMSGL